MFRLRVVGWVLLLLAVPGCGYRFTSRAAGLPEGVRSVCAPIFRNDTSEPALEVLFTRTFRQELARAGVLGSGTCEATIEGVVVSVSSYPTLINYRASATVVVRLLKDGRVLSETTVAGNDDFLTGQAGVPVDVLEAESNRQAALQRLAETLMREAYDRLATRW
jgi:hypothetical protein